MLAPNTQLFNRYKITRKIGEGHFAEVWAAIDTRLDREVAVKRLPIGKGYDAAEAEAKLLAKLHDPNIITLWDFDISEVDEAVYLIQEYAKGGTLRTLLNRHSSLPEEQAVGYAGQICLGLSYAHEKGVLHRDLKPENLFLSEGGLKIGDFGLARMLAGSEKASSVGTGTVQYTAPEQFDPGYDKRIDIWAMGVILFEMLTGEVPFTGEGWRQVMKQIIVEDVEMPRSISQSLAVVIQKALEKEPEDRFQTADEMRAALGNLSPGPSPESRGEKIQGEGRRSARREAEQVKIITPQVEPGLPQLPSGLVYRDGKIFSAKDNTQMVLIPKGEFMMGTDAAEISQIFEEAKQVNSKAERSWFEREVPRHSVSLDAFYIDIYPVTNAQYCRFVEETGHPEPIGHQWIDGKWKDGFAPWKSSNFNTDNQPVVCVSWQDAMAYCQWAGKRLPTEAEWEYAARGGLDSKGYVWGDETPDETRTNFGRKVGKTTPVRKYPPNGYGLYDMAGNVWEWCLDKFQADFYQNSPKENPFAGGDMADAINNSTNKTVMRVLRGGSWNNDSFLLRVACRDGDNPTDTYFYYGFRSARALTP